MLRFHIDCLGEPDSLQQPTTHHVFQGRLKVPRSIEDRILLHPEAHAGWPGPVCPWVRSVVCLPVALSWQALQQLAREEDRPVLAALAACAREANGHLTVWRS